MESTLAQGVSNAFAVISQILTEVINLITTNELCLIFVTAGLVVLAMRIFKKAKNTAK